MMVALSRLGFLVPKMVNISISANRLHSVATFETAPTLQTAPGPSGHSERNLKSVVMPLMRLMSCHVLCQYPAKHPLRG